MKSSLDICLENGWSPTSDLLAILNREMSAANLEGWQKGMKDAAILCLPIKSKCAGVIMDTLNGFSGLKPENTPSTCPICQSKNTPDKHCVHYAN